LVRAHFSHLRGGWCGDACFRRRANGTFAKRPPLAEPPWVTRLRGWIYRAGGRAPMSCRAHIHRVLAQGTRWASHGAIRRTLGVRSQSHDTTGPPTTGTRGSTLMTPYAPCSRTRRGASYGANRRTHGVRTQSHNTTGPPTTGTRGSTSITPRAPCSRARGGGLFDGAIRASSCEFNRVVSLCAVASAATCPPTPSRTTSSCRGAGWGAGW